MIVREATPDDNRELIALSSSRPMESDIVVRNDRSPDYFYLPRLQGFNSKVFVCEHRNSITGTIGVSYRYCILSGESVKVGYTGGLAVRQDARGGSTLFRLMKAVDDDLKSNNTHFCMLTTLSKNQPLVRLISGRVGIPAFHPIADFKVFHMIPAGFATGSNDYVIDQPGNRDTSIIIDMMRRFFKRYEFCERFDQERFDDLLGETEYFSLKNFLVARHHDRIVALVSFWDQSSFKRTIVEQYAGKYGLLRQLLKPFNTLPPSGEPLKTLAIRHIAHSPGHESAARLLVRHVISAFKHQFRLVRIGFHERDPLIHTVKRIVRISTAVTFFMAFRNENLHVIDHLRKSLIWEDMSLH